MKKILFVALAAVGLTACVQNEELAISKSNAITFDNVYVGNATKAAIDGSYTAEKGNLDHFNVWATISNTNGTANIFKNEAVTKNNAGVWSYAVENTQYWIPGNNYVFVGVVDGTVASVDSYNMPLTISTSLSGQQDVLYDTESRSYNGEAVTPVHFNFEHLLAKVKFTAKNVMTTSDSELYYTVESIKITNADNEAVYTIEDEAWAANGEPYTAEFGAVKNNNGETATLYYQNRAESNYELLVLPQENKSLNIVVNYTLRKNAWDSWTQPYEKELTATLDIEKGRAYNFVLELGNPGAPIEFTAAVTDWDTEITTPVGRYVSTIEQLQNALNTPASELGQNETLNIYLGADLAGDVTVLQKKGVNIVLDGCGHEYDGIITVNGDARAAGEETLTIQNIKFEATEAKTFISAPSKIDGRYNYSHNVTIQNCTFTGNYPAVEVGAANFTGTYNLVVKNCVATNMHSALQVTSCDNDVLVDGYVVTGCKGGISVNNTARPVLRNVTIEAEGYGVRGNGTLQNGGVVCNLVVEDATITAAQPIVIRKTTQNYKLTLGENVVLNHTAGVYDVVFTNGDDGTEVVPTGTFSYSSVADFNVFPTAYVAAASTEDFSSAINNPEVAEVNVTSAVDFSTITVNRELELNFNDQASTIGTTAGYGVLAREGADLTINDANFTSVGGAVNAAAGAQVTFNSGDVTINSTQTSQRHIFYAAQDGTVVTVNGGNFTIDAYRQRCYACAQYNAVIYIKGGTFGVAPNHPRWTYPIYTDNGGQVIITGGTFGFDPSEWVAAGYKAEKNGSTWTVVAE